MSKFISRLNAIQVAPPDPEDFDRWLEQADMVDFLTTTADESVLPVYASASWAYIHAVSVPASRLEPPDFEDLLAWNFSAFGSWGVSSGMEEPISARLEPPLFHTSSETLDGAEKLVFPGHFEGRTGEKSYVEVLQKLCHAFGLHFLDERSAYCRIDERGDIEDVVRIDRVPLTKARARWSRRHVRP